MLPVQKEEGKKKQPKKRPEGEGGEGEECIRTVCHLRHFPDIPGGNITIECTGRLKHCNMRARQHKTNSNDKNGLEKKEKRALFKNRISAATERRGEI